MVKVCVFETKLLVPLLHHRGLDFISHLNTLLALHGNNVIADNLKNEANNRTEPKRKQQTKADKTEKHPCTYLSMYFHSKKARLTKVLRTTILQFDTSKYIHRLLCFTVYFHI